MKYVQTYNFTTIRYLVFHEVTLLCLFNYDFSVALFVPFVTSRGQMTVNDKLDIMWKEAVVAYFRTVSYGRIKETINPPVIKKREC